MVVRFRLERQFGTVVGGIFLALGLWTGWRGSWPPLLSGGSAALGAILVAVGLVAPALLVWPRRGWMALAEVLGFVSTRVILGVVFFLILTPLAVVMRVSGWDPLASRRRRGTSHWMPYPSRIARSRHFEQMF